MARRRFNRTTSARRWTTCCSRAASSTSSFWAARWMRWWADVALRWCLAVLRKEFEVKNTRRVGLFGALVLLLGLFGSSFAAGQQPAKSATVVLAVDLRELTSIRDVSHVGDVLFRRLERRGGAAADYDL